MPTDADLDRIDAGAGSKSGSISVMLAQTYDPDRDDPKGWLMSEKLDGVRCYWNGTTMFTRNGNRIFAPDEWRDQLPKIALDGELWSGRDSFQSIVSTVRRTEPDSDKWKDIKFMVFDAPLVKGTFAQRIKLVQSKVDEKNAVVKVIS
jgi:DNA ligase-1